MVFKAETGGSKILHIQGANDGLKAFMKNKGSLQ
jgi:hypothetical protein